MNVSMHESKIAVCFMWPYGIVHAALVGCNGRPGMSEVPDLEPFKPSNVNDSVFCFCS